MKLAVEHFSSEYDHSKKALGIGFILFFQLEWNKLMWSDISSTKSLWYNLTDQMETRNRVKKNILSLKIAFGKAKANQHFDCEDDLMVYADGAGLTFS